MEQSMGTTSPRTFENVGHPGKIIRRLRKEQGLNQKELAFRAATDQQMISLIENGHNTTWDLIIRILKSLNYKISIHE